MNKLHRKHLHYSPTNLLVDLILVFMMLVSFLPIIWMIMNAFKSNNQIFAEPLAIPNKFDLSVFSKAWETAKFSVAFKNSLVATTVSVLIIQFAASTAGFAISHLKFRGRVLFLTFFVSAQVVSAQIILLPLFQILKGMQLLGHLQSIIFVTAAVGIPQSVYLFWGFFKGLSQEIYESAKIDGCNDYVYYARFVLPLSKPIIATVTILQAIGIWNEYLFALTFLSRPQSRTVPLQLQNFFSAHSADWSGAFAALSICVVPILILYIILQKYFIRGLTEGSVKG